MRIGSLNREVEVQVLETSTGAGTRGEETAAFVTVERVWAAITQLSGREAVIARQIDDTATHRIDIRTNDNVTQRSRFKYGSRYFNIGSVVDDRQSRFMTCTCTEEV